MGTTPPAPESCNGRDDDCDGRTDEDLFSTCWPAGACSPGIARCGDPTCYFAVLPEIEMCDLADNDCDGQIDEGFPACCGRAAEEEVCDGEDNNCNGRIDERLRDACGYCLGEAPAEVACNGLDDDCDGATDEDDSLHVEVAIAVDTSGSNADGLGSQKAALQAAVRDLGALITCLAWDVVWFPSSPSGAGGMDYLARAATAADAEAAIARMTLGPGFLEPSYDVAVSLAAPADPLAVRSVILVADEDGQSMLGLNETSAAAVLKTFGVEALTFSWHPLSYDALGLALPLYADIHAESVRFVRARAGL